MHSDKQIIAAIAGGKIKEARKLATDRSYTLKSLRTAAEERQFELLWDLYQIAKKRGMNVETFLLDDVISCGKIEVIDYFFGGKLDPNFRFGLSETTVLMKACFYGQRTIVEHLLDYGCNPEQEDVNKRNAFFYAVLCSDINILRLLFLQTKRIDYVDDYQGTILHRMCGSVFGKCKEILDEILSLDVLDVNAQDQFGDTALHLAFRWYIGGAASIYQLLTLINHPKINLSIQNHDGKTVWDLCQEVGRITPIVYDALRGKIQ